MAILKPYLVETNNAEGSFSFMMRKHTKTTDNIRLTKNNYRLRRKNITIHEIEADDEK